MKISKRITTLTVLSALVILGVAATKPDDGYKNLKVLPKNISHDELGKDRNKSRTESATGDNIIHKIGNKERLRISIRNAGGTKHESKH